MKRYRYGGKNMRQDFDPKKGMAIVLLILFIGFNILPSLHGTKTEQITQAKFVDNSVNGIGAITDPVVQLIVVDDGSGSPTDNKVNVPAYIDGTGVAGTIDVVFDIIGTNLTSDQTYYGDNIWEDSKNITISGDILYPTSAVYTGFQGRWDVDITPTKPGGTITLIIDWPGEDNGTASQTIDIVNGTFVVPAAESFQIGADYNLTVTVTDMDGSLVKNAHVYLMWQDIGVQFNDTIGTNTLGNGANGEYTFWIRPHSKDPTTPDTAPQNITIAAKWFTGFWGYTTVIMGKQLLPPTIEGPDWGIINVEYTFYLKFNGSNGDPIYSLWSWGDGNFSGWLGPYSPNGTLCVTHTWSQEGTYEIRVKFKDTMGAESEWSDPHTITIHKIGTAIIFGTYGNLTNEGDHIIMTAGNFRLMLFGPLQLVHYTTGEAITVPDDYIGILRGRFIVIIVNFGE
jgi:hypothetical protein